MPTAKRAVSKLSPAVMTPEQFLAGFPLEVQILAHELRGLVRAAVPIALEKVTFGWRLIGYRSSDQTGTVYFCFIALREDCVELGFENGVLMQDPDGALHARPNMLQVRYVPIRTMANIQPEKLIALIREAARVSILSKNSKHAVRKTQQPLPKD